MQAVTRTDIARVIVAVVVRRPMRRVWAVFLCTWALIPAGSRAQGLVGEWELLAGPVDPPSMVGHAAVHDAARDRMVVVNGLDPHELWILSLPSTGSPTWSRVAVQGSEFPPTRDRFTAVLDTAIDRVIVFGGMLTYGTAGNDVWSLSLAEPPHWEQLHPSGAPPAPRAEPAAVFDPVRRRVVFFGGGINSDDSPRVFYADTWSLDLEPEPRWTRLSPLGTTPGARKGAAAVLDPLNNRMVVFGGYTPSPYGNRSGYDDTWTLSLSGDAKWKQLPVTDTPGVREQALAVLDPVDRRILLTGGNGVCKGGATDTWTLPLDPGLAGAPVAWSQLVTTGENPPNALQAGIFSPERSSMIQFGGQHGWSESDELHLATGQWRQINSAAPASFPSRRSLPALLPDQEKGGFLFFGGIRAGFQVELWAFDEAAPSIWNRLPTEADPTPALWFRILHDEAHQRLLCFNTGNDEVTGSKITNVYELRLDGPRIWKQLMTRGSKPLGREEFGLALDTRRNRVLLFGGDYFQWHERYGQPLDDLWSLSLDDLTWTQMQPVNSPGSGGGIWATYDERLDRMLLLGVETFRHMAWTRPNDLCSLPLGGDRLEWQPLGSVTPVPRPVAFDRVRRRLVLWDGAAAAWSLSVDDPRGWEPLALTGQHPTPREKYSLTYDVHDDRMIAYGGQDGSLNFLGDVEAIRFSRPVAVELRSPFSHERPWGDKQAGWIELAVLGESDAPVDAIQVSTATLGGAHVAMLAGRPWVQRRDVNHDRVPDLLLRFPADSVKVDPAERALWFVAATTGLDVRAAVRLDGRRRPPDADIAKSADPDPTPGISVENPSRNSLALRLTMRSTSAAQLDVFDVAGRRVLHRDLYALQPGEQRLQLPRRDLASGFYFVRIRQGAASAVARAIIVE